MFDVKTNSEIQSINVRTEVHGDELKRAMDVKFVAQSVPLTKISSALPEFDQFFDKDQPKLQEIYPLRVRHKIENCNVKISGGRSVVKLNGCDVAKISITPVPAKMCNIEFTVQARDYSDGCLDKLTKWLRESVNVEVFERQLKLAETS